MLSCNEALAPKTTLNVGGTADMWSQVETLADLKTIVRWSADNDIATRLIGAGSNLLVSDLGVRGIVARLTGKQFRDIRLKDNSVIVGAALPLVRLLDWLEKEGWTGLEFLDGIPGTVGGALRMNAGAFGGAIGDHVAWVKCLDGSGEETVLDAPRLAYRAGVDSEYIIEAALRVEKGDVEEIRRRRDDLLARREHMKGLRCAGSVFKNPENDFAGRLLEEAGMKGMAIGNARIWTEHANVIVTEHGACASDVRALMELARRAVADKFDIVLENEIVVLE
jgi:UDP-N-acetylmuramate dehydrogenase